MKKLCTLIILCFSVNLFAQLNGIYTIGTGGNYATMQLAVTALTTNGVSGSVIFNIKPGTYDVYSLTFGTVAGASPANNITFQSEDLNANSVVLMGCNMTLNTAAVTFNEIKFNIHQSSNPSNAKAFEINGNNCSISNCIFYHNYNPVTEAMYSNVNSKETLSNIVVKASDLSITNNTFEGSVGCCILKNGSLKDNLTISNNIFNINNVCSIELNLLNNFTIYNNVFSGETIKNAIVTTSIRGNVLIERNTINNSYNSGLNSALSLTAISPSGTIASNIVLRNNFVNSMGPNLRITNFKDVKVLNNNFKSAYNCIYVEPNSLSSAYVIKNNVFYSSGNMAMNFPANIFESFVTADYNAFSGNNGKPIFRSPYFYSVADWQNLTGKEMHSRISDLVFVGATDLHTPNALILSNNGESLADVTADFDGEGRSGTPDIGADEFTMDVSTYRDLELVSIISPAVTDCNNTSIILSIKNNGATVVNTFDVEASINNYPGSTSEFTATVNPGQTISLPFGNMPLITNNVYDKIAFRVKNPNHLLDNNFSNDIKVLTDYAPLGDFPIVVEKDNCGTYKSLTIALGGNSILWSNGSTSNRITINGPGTYSVTVTNTVGCSFTKSITLN